MTDVSIMEAHLRNLSKSSNMAEQLRILTQMRVEIDVIITQISLDRHLGISSSPADASPSPSHSYN